MKDYFRPEDIKWLIDKLSEIQTRSPLIDQIGHWCEEQLKVCKNEQGSEAPKYEGLNASFDMIQQLKKVSEYNEWENNSVQELCRRCGFVPDDQFYPEVRYSPGFHAASSLYPVQKLKSEGSTSADMCFAGAAWSHTLLQIPGSPRSVVDAGRATPCLRTSESRCLQ